MIGACALLTVLLAGPLIPIGNKADSAKIVQPEGGLGLPYSVGTYTFVDGPYAGQTVTLTTPQTDGLTKALDKTNDSTSIGWRGRTYLTFTLAPITSIASDTLVTGFVKNAAGTVTTSVSSYTITSGKTFHITSISLSTRSTSTTVAQTTSFLLRNNTAGATTNASALVGQWECTASPAASAAGGQACTRDIPLGDYGLMFVGDGTNSIGMDTSSSSVNGKDGITIIGYEDNTP